MRQLKVVVMAVGVALSVAPIFSSAVAQQGNSQANMLLDVQSMRQEIAQLRDMVERQQFEMRKLKRQHVEMQKVLSAGQVPQSALDQNGLSQSNNYDASNVTPYQPRLDEADSSAYLNQQVVSQNETPATNYPVNAGNNIPTNTSNGALIEERVITAAPKYSDAASSDGAVPVVDRSFNQRIRNVPTTGSGSAVDARQQIIDGAQQTSQFPEQADAALSTSSLPVAVTNTQQSATGGVIAIPQKSTGEWQTKSSVSVRDSSQAIIANKAPVDPNAVVQNSNVDTSQVSAAQNFLAATDSSANGAPTLSEDDYYSQGFELLKQSKYEEASIIFERQIKAYPRGNLADDAHYWIAEAMHVSRKLDVSKQHLKIIINDYPQSPRLPDAMLKTAYIEQSQGNKMEAQILFQEIVSLHPKSDAAIAAKNQLASN